jgi:sugar (pentulose or hexulose) kinase
LTSHRQNVLVFGGGTRSRFIQRLLADILGAPLLVSPTSETALLGAAVLAGFGAGVYTSLSEATALVREGATWCEPRAKATDIYPELYAQYREQEDELLHLEWQNDH